MPQLDDLYLHEQLLLLALNDEKGTVQGQSFEVGAGSALLIELLLSRRIAIDESAKKHPVKVVDTESLGDPILDEVLQRIRTAKRPEPLKTWIGRVSGTKRLRHRIADRLRYRGILGKREGRVLLVFSRTLYPTANPEPERELVERIRQAVLADGEVAPRTALIGALAQHLGLLRYVLSRAELKACKRRIEQWSTVEASGDAPSAAIKAVQQVIAEHAAAAAIAAGG